MAPPARAALGLLAALAGCGDATHDGADGGAADAGDRPAGDAGAADAAPWACPATSAVAVAGTITTSDVELSGLTASAAVPGLLWSHNDDPGRAELLAFGDDGVELADVALDAEVTDLEDVVRVAGTGGGADLLYLADTGDNDRARDAIQILRIAEPAVSLADRDRALEADGAAAFTLTYPDGPHDAEAIVIEPGTGDLFLFTKADGGDPVTALYRRAGFAAASPGATLTLERVLDDGDAAGLTGSITAAALSPDGGLLLLAFKDAGAFRLWPRVGSIADTVRGTPCQVPAADGQVEGVTFAADGAGYFMVAEAADPDLAFVAFDP